MLAIIFANGDFCEPHLPSNFGDDALIIAADGGSRHCQSLKILPHLLVGDLDSIDPDLAASWQEKGVEVIRHPTDKDQTDLELALLLAQDRGATEARIYGAVGGRLDMTFGNLMLLAHPQLSIPSTLICGAEEVHLLHPDDSLTLNGSIGDKLSLLPLHPDGARVSAKGVHYPLRGDLLEFGLTRGISNQMTQVESFIHLETGLLAVIHTRSNTLEEVS
jgi:thiamine pyrophosphokinase